MDSLRFTANHVNRAVINLTVVYSLSMLASSAVLILFSSKAISSVLFRQHRWLLKISMISGVIWTGKLYSQSKITGILTAGKFLKLNKGEHKDSTNHFVLIGTEVWWTFSEILLVLILNEPADAYIIPCFCCLEYVIFLFSISKQWDDATKEIEVVVESPVTIVALDDIQFFARSRSTSLMKDELHSRRGSALNYDLQTRMGNSFTKDSALSRRSSSNTPQILGSGGMDLTRRGSGNAFSRRSSKDIPASIQTRQFEKLSDPSDASVSPLSDSNLVSSSLGRDQVSALKSLNASREEFRNRPRAPSALPSPSESSSSREDLRARARSPSFIPVDQQTRSPIAQQLDISRIQGSPVLPWKTIKPDSPKSNSPEASNLPTRARSNTNELLKDSINARIRSGSVAVRDYPGLTGSPTLKEQLHEELKSVAAKNLLFKRRMPSTDSANLSLSSPSVLKQSPTSTSLPIASVKSTLRVKLETQIMKNYTSNIIKLAAVFQLYLLYLSTSIHNQQYLKIANSNIIMSMILLYFAISVSTVIIGRAASFNPMQELNELIVKSRGAWQSLSALGMGWIALWIVYHGGTQ